MAYFHGLLPLVSGSVYLLPPTLQVATNQRHFLNEDFAQPVTVTTRKIPLWNPELNLHLFLESWVGGRPRIIHGSPQKCGGSKNEGLKNLLPTRVRHPFTKRKTTCLSIYLLWTRYKTAGPKKYSTYFFLRVFIQNKHPHNDCSTPPSISPSLAAL